MSEAYEDYQSEIDMLQEEVDECIENRDNIELNPVNYTEEYNEYLKNKEDLLTDDISFPPIELLKIAYVMGLSEYVRLFCDVDSTEEYQYYTERIDELESEIENLQEQLDELENEEDDDE